MQHLLGAVRGYSYSFRRSLDISARSKRPGQSNKQLARGNDVYSKRLPQRQQIVISRYNDLRSSGQSAGQVRIIFHITAPLFAQRRGLHTLNMILVPGKYGSRWMSRPVPAVNQQMIQFLDGFLCGIGNDPAVSHRHQAAMRFTPPPGGRKHHPRVKNNLHGFFRRALMRA